MFTLRENAVSRRQCSHCARTLSLDVKVHTAGAVMSLWGVQPRVCNRGTYNRDEGVCNRGVCLPASVCNRGVYNQVSLVVCQSTTGCL